MGVLAGFGGSDEFDQFRIWLDDELESASYVHTEDDAYQIGYVAGESEGRLELAQIEVWGLGGQKALERQVEYRREKQEELERMRKVDRKMFFSSFDQEMFFGRPCYH